MRYLAVLAALALPLAPALAQDVAKPAAVVAKPAALIADGMPDIPAPIWKIAAPGSSAGIRLINRC
jgi:hypothetical protein